MQDKVGRLKLGMVCGGCGLGRRGQGWAELNVGNDISRDAVYKNGIRTTEFFKDHDKLRSGIITETQVRGAWP